MIYRLLTVFSVLTFSFAFTTTDDLKTKLTSSKTEAVFASIPENGKNLSFEAKVANLYNEFSTNNISIPTMPVFSKAIKGYDQLEETGKVGKKILTVIDFGLSSTKKRMWIMDMETKKVLFNTYVSHGKNTGGEFATKFSNTVNSLQSSLGFYVTAETYYGRNGLSLFIDGMEKGFNSNARKRYVVIHGADYAEPNFIDKIGRLGRSYGCPAVPNTIAKEVIDTIKEESVVYIHKNNKEYLEKSTLLNS
ncbi:murein L,D-transpeptidase catalytic domain family protein [Salegentibacter maritimus]|uniref:Murein L,D-transpeptidase catalytic domain family protein n=1 Tax=Salegentibacter maritimus TaxID=2794347 RepID=A0ABS0TEU7_9FLAO|nr:murein L,D-transpeptidase catalytic domain family protein [Salegentibacter maritimus]MBI6119586.1 murein L,D-transpeptidase catalytic domain family protein [Salegentibacter maritimus]